MEYCNCKILKCGDDVVELGVVLDYQWLSMWSVLIMNTVDESLHFVSSLHSTTVRICASV